MTMLRSSANARHAAFRRISLKTWLARAVVPFATAAFLSPAHASMFKGEALDSIANGIAWVVVVIVAVIGIAVLWMVHILPEKIAEKRKHPQAKAIQILCLLSLVFGALLWPLAFLWAYRKPVLYKLQPTAPTPSNPSTARRRRQLNRTKSRACANRWPRSRNAELPTCGLGCF